MLVMVEVIGIGTTDVRRMFVGCSLDVRWMLVGCSLDVRRMFVGCSLGLLSECHTPLQNFSHRNQKTPQSPLRSIDEDKDNAVVEPVAKRQALKAAWLNSPGLIGWID